MSSSVAATAPKKRTRKPLYPRGWGSGNVAYVGTFRAFSLAVLGRSSLEIGDKIILPPAALQSINRLRLPFPLIFEVRKYEKSSSSHMLSQNEVMNQYKRRIENIYRSTNPAKIHKIDKWLRKYSTNPHQLYTKICKTYGIVPKPKITPSLSLNNTRRMRNNSKNKQKSIGKQYCSVYEFSSPQPDSAYLPHWMMQNLGIDEGHKIELESKFNIRKGTFCKLQPYKQEFMDKVSTIGYKSTLEHSLRHYSVLSVNQRIVVEFNHFPYECVVKQTKPTDVVSILGSTDLEIEFEPPLEHTHTTTQPPQIDAISCDDDDDDGDESSSSLSSSSFGIAPAAATGPIPSAQIDGILLKKLGVPLDYNEQTNLATMIVENRKLMRENESRFDDENNESSEEEKTEMNGEDETSDCVVINEEEEHKSPQGPGPNEVECNNCGKYIHSMSIQMHEVHCIREYIRCDVCNECIRKGTKKEEHWREYHEERTCICNQICCGSIQYATHKENECALRLMECRLCGEQNIAFINMEQHESTVCKRTMSVMCSLCGEQIADSKDKLLHLLTICKERRAICNYCGVFRMCNDMEQHRAFCGSRSEKCTKCNQFVSLMNMEPHLQSNCQWFNNNQLSAVSSNSNQKSKSNAQLKSKLESLDLNHDANNPYIDGELLDNVHDSSSLFGLLKSNPQPNLLDIDNGNSSFAMDAVTSAVGNKQLCPHCDNDDCLMNEEEFHLHIAITHPQLANNSLTQTIMASFHNDEILNSQLPLLQSSNSYNKINKKKRRKLSIRNQKWSCNVCTFVNAKSKQRCIVCKAPRS